MSRKFIKIMNPILKNQLVLKNYQRLNRRCNHKRRTKIKWIVKIILFLIFVISCLVVFLY